MQVDKLDTDQGIRAIELCQDVSEEILAKWCKENDVKDKDALILSILDHLCMVNQEDPRKENMMWWPTVSYGEVARDQGLTRHERLNLLPEGKDEREELDELFDDPSSRNAGPLDKRTICEVLALQVQMEEQLIIVDRYSSGVFDTRQAQRAVLDRHMKAYAAGKAGGPKHYEMTQKLMAANSRARNAAMQEGKEDAHPAVVTAWDAFNGYKDQLELAMGADKRYYSLIVDIAPFVSKLLSKGERSILRHKRIKWLDAALLEYEVEVQLEESDGLSINWISRNDEESRVYDDAWAHNESLVRDEDLAWDHIREMRSQQLIGPTSLYFKAKEWVPSKGDLAYWAWLTKKYQAWWTATQARSFAPTQR